MKNKFPVYRKYDHGRTYFKILSTEEFIEIGRLGSSYSETHFKAKIFPDRNLISDMLANSAGHWVEIDSEEYESFVNETKRDFAKL